MSLLWLWGLALLALLVNGASVVKRSVEPGKKIVRHGDELFLVDIDEDESTDHRSSENQQHNHRQKRFTDDQGRQVIRVGDELIVLKDDGDDASDDVISGGHLGAGIHRRAAIKDESYRWTDKTVPYLFDNTFGPKDKAIVKSAMDEWSRHTCVKFRPARSSDANKVKFVQGDGCFSFVGMVEKTQDISLDKDGCRLVSTALHEIGHALGMYHTQVRPDRDRFVKIDMSDVAKNLQDNFEKQTWENAHHYGVDYDFKSIMHYDGTSFTSNGGTSIKTLDPKWQKIIGNMEHLSFGDIEMMNKMYHCAPKPCNLKDSDCPGTSFVDQTCKCVCPGSSSTNPVVPCSGSGGGSHRGSSQTSSGSSQGSSSGNEGAGAGPSSHHNQQPTSSDWDQGGEDWEDGYGYGDDDEWEDVYY